MIPAFAAFAGALIGTALVDYLCARRMERRLRQHLETSLVEGLEEARAQVIAQIPGLISRGGRFEAHRRQPAAGVLTPREVRAASSSEQRPCRSGRFLRPHPNYFPPAVTDPEIRRLLIRRSRKARVNDVAALLFKTLTLGMFPHYSFFALSTDRESDAISLAVRKARAKAEVQDAVE